MTPAGAVPLTTPQRVRDRLGVAPPDLDDPVLEGLIAEQQAYVEASVGVVVELGDPRFALAGSATTDLAATMALVRLTLALSAGADYRLGKLDVRKRHQLQAWLQLIPELRASAERALEVLRHDARARRFLVINGVN